MYRIAALVALMILLLLPLETVGARESKANRTMGLNAADFEQAADAAIASLLDSGAVDRPGGGRYVLVVSRIINDTTQRIDTDQLVKKIRIALLRSGKVVTTTAIGLDGAEDEMTHAARELRGNAEFDQRGVAGSGQLQAPDYSLSGKIIQRVNTIDRRTQQVDYYFQLSLTDINSGLAYWEDEYPITKVGKARTTSW
ncbi:MAG: penicillin-binding protein activator LpoB [Aquimonas sp.]|nr:penicillin-binding protein activator LpoB [Aquimonas sp.]